MLPKIRRIIQRATLAIVIAAAVFALACGDDDDGSNGDNESPTPTQSGDATASPTGDPGETDSPTAGTATPAITGTAAELRDLVQNWIDGVDGTVAYDYDSNFGQHPDGTYTIYRLDGDSRHDWLNNAGGFGVTIVTIITDEAAYVCNIAEVNQICRETEEQEARDTRVVFLIVEQTMQVVAGGISDASVDELPDEEIAGVEAGCYQLTTTGRISEGPPGTEEIKFCFSEQGRLLSLHHDVFFEEENLPQGDLNFVAMEVGEASAEDFEPPAEVVN